MVATKTIGQFTQETTLVDTMRFLLETAGDETKYVLLEALKIYIQGDQETLSTTTTVSKTVSYGNAASATITLSLPSSPTDGEEHVLKKIDNSVNAVTVSGNGNDIDGSASFALSAQYNYVHVKWDNTGGEWRVIGST